MIKELLKKLLPPEEKIFFTLFEQGATTCREAAELFSTITCEGIKDEYMVQAKTIKRSSNATAKKTLYKLNNTFITPIDREDIQDLTSLLNKIAKKIVKACFNMRVYRLPKGTDAMQEQAKTLLKATDELIVIVTLLKKVSQIKEITQSNHRMKEIESVGDDIIYRALDELFSGKYEALEVIKLRDIYKDIENALDACFSVADEVLSIMLKHN